MLVNGLSRLTFNKRDMLVFLTCLCRVLINCMFRNHTLLKINFLNWQSDSLVPKIQSLKQNRPLALRGHVTNASFKQWLGILLMTKIDRAHNNYLRPEIWEKMHLIKGDILLNFDFSTKQYNLYWPPCWRAYSCSPKLFFARILLKVWYLRSDVL